MEKQFENLGYFLEYLVDGKYIGSINIDKPDRKEIGYYGKIELVAENDIIFTNNKKIKKGQIYYTRMYPLNGRLK